MNVLSQKLKELRLIKGFSQEELSERSGISIRTIQRIEKGDSEPRGTTLQLLCGALGQDIKDIISVEKIEPIVSRKYYLSILVGLIIPLGNVLGPFIVCISNNREEFKKEGKHIICNQIVYALLSAFIIIIWTIGKINQVTGINYVLMFFLCLSFANYGVSVYALYKMNKETKRMFYYPFFKK